MHSIFGKNPVGERLAAIEKSPHYHDGSFHNTEETPLLVDTTRLQLLKKMFSKPGDVKPAKPLPVIKTDLQQLQDDTPGITWFGHSSYLVSYRGLNILVDPVFSGNAAPVPGMVRSFKGTDIYKAEDFPVIDILIITHDHYDHLDYFTIKKLKPKIRQVVTSLGVGSHLVYWGIPAENITELDWWQEKNIGENITITATPARHFSGRSFIPARTFWSSFVLQLQGYRLFLGGDSGYGDHFRMIGEKFDGFDIALLEMGQYSEYWPDIHMMPEQTLAAAKDLGAKILLPVHWGKFALAYHPWNEPPKRLMAAAAVDSGPEIVLPEIGRQYLLDRTFEQHNWWDTV